MSSGIKKKKHTKFTFRSLIRLIVFGVIFFLTISLISNQKLNPNQVDKIPLLSEQQNDSILGKTTEISNKIYQSIPPESRHQLENLNQTPAIIYIQEKINYLKEESKYFPQKQIKEIQKMIINQLYENSMRSIDSQ